MEEAKIKMNKFSVGLNPNVFIHTSAADIASFVFHVKLAKFLEIVAPKHPEMEFISKPSRSTSELGERIAIGSLRVECKGEEVGQIYIRGAYDDCKIHLRNDKIANDLERGYTRSTTNPTRAARTFERYFKPRTLNEVWEEGNDAIRGGIYNASSQVSYKQSNLMGKLVRVDTVQDFIMQNWAEVRTLLPEESRQVDGVEMPELIKNAAIARKIQHMNAGSRGTVAFFTRKMWHIKAHNMPIVETYAKDMLPAWLKTSIGMLKLVEDNSFMSDHGYRLNENTFYITREPDYDEPNET